MDALEEDLDPSLEIDDQVGLGDPRRDGVVDPLVERQLGPLEGEGGEDAVLGEEVVAEGHLREEVLLHQLLLLLEPREEEEDLGLEGVGVPVRVEVGEEGVVLDHLVDHAPAETFGQRTHEGRLAHPDGSLHHDVTCRQHARGGCHNRARSETRSDPDRSVGSIDQT